MNPIDKLIKLYGNAPGAARVLGLDRQFIYNWQKTGIPYKRGLFIEKKTNGAITASEVWQAASKANR